MLVPSTVSLGTMHCVPPCKYCVTVTSCDEQGQLQTGASGSFFKFFVIFWLKEKRKGRGRGGGRGKSPHPLPSQTKSTTTKGRLVPTFWLGTNQNLVLVSA